MTTTNTNRSTDGRYAHRDDRICKCGHAAGEHTAVRITKTKDQPCLADGCDCLCFTQQQSGAKVTKTTYEITLPDGSTRRRNSARTYTHAVVSQDERGWYLVGFCGSLQLAEKRAADWRRCLPDETTQIVPARVIVPPTDRQRRFLTEIGDRTLEIMGTSQLVAIVKRGLLERSFIGQRWWRVRRTEAGRKAVEAAP